MRSPIAENSTRQNRGTVQLTLFDSQHLLTKKKGFQASPSKGNHQKILPNVKLRPLKAQPIQNPKSKIQNRLTPHRFDLAQDDVRAGKTRTQRILFKPGAVSAVVESSIGRGSQTIYLLRARRGQIMTLSLTSLDQNAVFDIQAPDGQFLQQDTTSYRGELPLTGDYSVIVSGIRGNAEYTLDVTIR